MDRESLFAALRQRLYLTLRSRSLSPDAADEIAQQAALILLTKYEEGRDELDLIMLGFGIVKKLILERGHRSRESQADGKLIPMPDPPDPQPTPEKNLEIKEQRELLARAIEQLGEQCRKVTLLRLQNLSRTQIAQRLGVTPNLAGVWESRCLKRLKAILDGDPKVKGASHG
jgi:RNA polymerase sigma factor (sigma-70 family)